MRSWDEIEADAVEGDPFARRIPPRPDRWRENMLIEIAELREGRR